MSSITRRTFIKSSTVLAAASTATASAQHLAAANDRINAAVFGCRNQGALVAQCMLQSGRFNVITLCDCDTAMSASAMNKIQDSLTGSCTEIQDFRIALDDPNVEAVVIAAPDHWHALMTTMALDAGKHVYVEKPASFNIADGKAMVKAAHQHPDLTVQVGTMQRSGTHFIDACNFVQSGGLGKVGFARGIVVHHRGALPDIPDSDPPETMDYDLWVGPAPFRPYNQYRCHYEWHWTRDYGTGEMGNWGAHWLDICLWYLQLVFPKSVMALGGQYITKDIKEWPDTQTVLFEYPDLTLVWEHRLWSRQGLAGRFGNGSLLCGEKGSLEVTRAGWVFYPADGSQPERHEGSEMTIAHTVNFAEAIHGNTQPASTIEDGHVCATLCHLANIASILNRRLEFDGERQSIVNDEEAQSWEDREYRAPWSKPA